MSQSANRWLIRQAQRERVNQLNNKQKTLVHMNASEFVDYAVFSQMRRGKTEQQAIEWVEKHLHLDKNPNQDWQQHRSRFQFYSSLTPIGLDAAALTALAQEMKRSGRVFSKYRIKRHRGAEYVIFDGYSGLRQDLKGTRYLANNPKVVSMGIGQAGIKEVVKGGFIVSIFISAGFHGIDQLMDDSKTWHYFVGAVAVDVGIAVLASGLAWKTATFATGATAAIAIAPLFAIVVVGTVVSLGVYFFVDTQTLASSITNLLITVEYNLKNKVSEFNSRTGFVEREYKLDPIGFLHRLFGIPQSGARTFAS